jgi:hypothetical protein
MTLREKIATLFAESVGEDFSTFGEQDHLRAYYLEQAGHILAIPEIAAGQELLRAHGDMLAGGTSYVRVGRVDPATVKNDGHRISTAD